MCECIDKMRENIKKVDPKGSIDDIQSYLNKTQKVGHVKITYRMCGHGTVHKQRKDGTFTDKHERITLEYNFCPFCGEEYK